MSSGHLRRVLVQEISAIPPAAHQISDDVIRQLNSIELTKDIDHLPFDALRLVQDIAYGVHRVACYCPSADCRHGRTIEVHELTVECQVAIPVNFDRVCKVAEWRRSLLALPHQAGRAVVVGIDQPGISHTG